MMTGRFSTKDRLALVIDTAPKEFITLRAFPVYWEEEREPLSPRSPLPFVRQKGIPATNLAFGSDDSAYPRVQAYLTALIDGFEAPQFQLELQKLLLARPKSPQGHVIKKVVPGRCQLCQPIQVRAVDESKIPNHSEAAAWQMIARFVHDPVVIMQLEIIDELLALPANSYYKTVIECAGS